MHGLGRELRSLERDTAVMAYLLDPGEGKYLLEDLALRYLSLELTSPDQVEGTLDFDGEANARETGRRVAVLVRLGRRAGEALRGARARRPLRAHRAPARSACSPRWKTRASASTSTFLEELGKELGDECRRLEAEIHAHAGEQFNVNSTPQLRRILFEKLGLTPVKKTKTGPSTDADSLQKLAEEHPIVETLLRYREVEKLRSTYADALPPLVQADGRIHATFNQLATTTGRISSEAPNLQNVPVRTVDRARAAQGVHRRRGLRPAHRRLLADRAAGARAPRRRPGPHRRVRARRRRAHHHRGARSSTSTRTRSTSSSAASPRSSTTASRTAWRPTASAQRLDIPTDQAREILDAYFAAFPNIAAYMTGDDPRGEGVRATRPRSSVAAGSCPELSSDNFRIRQMGERMAQNAPVQGSAADIFKLAMIDLDRALDRRRASRAGWCSPCTTSSCSRCRSTSARRVDRRRARRRWSTSPSCACRSSSTSASGPPGPTPSRPGSTKFRLRRTAGTGSTRWRPSSGRAYLRNAFTKGTVQEVDFLVDALELRPGMRVLDAGCGPGRHALELARRGIAVVGVDASPDFVALARAAAGDLPVEFREARRAGAGVRRRRSTRSSACARAASACSAATTASSTSSLGSRPRCGRAAGSRSSAFSSYFVVRHLEPDETFDADTGVNHEHAVGARRRRVASAPSTSGRRATRRGSSGSSRRVPALDASTAFSVCSRAATRASGRRSTCPSTCCSHTAPI